MQPVFYVVEAFPKLSESFISGKALWLLEQGIPLWIIDKFPQQRQYQYFPESVQQAFASRTIGLYPGKNKLYRTTQRHLEILKAWGYGLSRYPMELRHYQKLVQETNQQQAPSKHPFASRKNNVPASIGYQRHIDQFLNFYYTQKLDPICIHVHFGFNALDWIPVKRILGNRIRLMVSFLGRDVTVDPQQTPNLYRELFEVGDFYLASSPYLRDLAIQYGCPPEKIQVHPVEIDTDFFHPANQGKPETSPLVITSVGRLVWEKDYETALNAMARLRTQQPNTPIIYNIVGEGPLARELLDKADSLGLLDRVRFLGAQNREAIRDLLWKTDVFLSSSVSEGLGASVLEAQACGLPAVITHAGGLPMTIKPNQSGFMVAPQQPESLVHALTTLLENPELRTQMGHAARRHVQVNFSAAVLYPKLLDYYGLKDQSVSE